MSRSLLLVSRDGEGFYDEMRVMYEDSPPARVILDQRSMLIVAAASRDRRVTLRRSPSAEVQREGGPSVLGHAFEPPSSTNSEAR
jgi:hypothetical protein